MANLQAVNVEAIADQVTRNAKAKPELWSDDVEYIHDSMTFLAAITGDENSNKVVFRKRRVDKGHNDTMHFTTVNPLGYEPVIGGAKIEGKEETAKDHSYSLSVGLVRNAAAIGYTNRLFTEAGNDIASAADAVGGRLREMLAHRRARRNTLWMLHEAKIEGLSKDVTTIRPDAKTRDEITAADLLSPRLIKSAALQLESNGAEPTGTFMDVGGSEIEEFLFLTSKVSLGNFTDSPIVMTAWKDGAVKGAENPLFKGEIGRWKGHSFFGFQPNQVIGNSNIGAPNIPMAKLGVTIAASTTAVDVLGGGNDYDSGISTDVMAHYFSGFSNYGLVTREGVTPSASTGTRYAVGLNADGTIFVFSFEVNSGYKLTMVERLGSSATGAQVTSLAGISGSASKVTNTLTKGATIVEVNAAGVRIGGTYGLGRGALLWGEGRDVAVVKPYSDNGGIDLAMQILDIQGVEAPKVTGDAIPRGLVYIEHAIEDGRIPTDFAAYSNT